MRRPKRKSQRMRQIETLSQEPIETLLRRFYLEQKLPQREIAQNLGVSQTCVSQWLRRFRIEYKDELLEHQAVND